MGCSISYLFSTHYYSPYKCLTDISIHYIWLVLFLTYIFAMTIGIAISKPHWQLSQRDTAVRSSCSPPIITFTMNFYIVPPFVFVTLILMPNVFVYFIATVGRQWWLAHPLLRSSQFSTMNYIYGSPCMTASPDASLTLRCHQFVILIRCAINMSIKAVLSDRDF